MDLEEQVQLYKETSLKITELEEQRKSLSRSIIQAMEGKALQLKDYHALVRSWKDHVYRGRYR